MDYSTWYRDISRPFRAPGTARALGLLDRALVYAFAGAYAVLLVVLALTHIDRLLAAVVVPASTFAIVTALRMLVNRPRPYEAHDIDALIAKDTRGKSMPSRHMASAVVIAFTCLQTYPVAGAILSAGCVVIAFTRIVGGVHYPSDIAAALVVGLACSALGFQLL